MTLSETKEIAESHSPRVKSELIWACIGFVLSLGFVAVAGLELVFWASNIASTTPSLSWLHFAALFWTAAALLNGCRWSVFVALSILAWQRKHSPLKAGYAPFVSIVVPCFNESDTIEPAMESLLALDYSKYEIVVVNDGSTDDTLFKARAFAGTHGQVVVSVHDKPNGGKWSALNLGVDRAQGELVLCVDADSRLDRPALRRLVPHLADGNVAGVAGQVRVRNRLGALTKLQALEYMLANGIVRLAQSRTGTVLVVPGPIGLFRRSALESISPKFGSAFEKPEPGQVSGPYCPDTFAEDFDLSLAILCHGEKIVYEPNAISRTKAPDKLFVLINQRYRWLRGSMQVIRKLSQQRRSDAESIASHVRIWVAATYVIDLVLSPLVFFLGAAFLLLLAMSGALLHLAALYAAFVGMYVALGIFAAVVHDEELDTLSVLPLYHFYSALLYGAWLISAFDELRGRRMKW